MSGYIIYHPRRQRSTFDGLTVYHDRTGSNQDPYVWNTRFLHTYCHMSQMRPVVGDVNFWVSGNTFPDFSQLYCDLVFVVQEKTYWVEANRISAANPLVDSPNAFIDHYQWAMYQHHFKRRRRFTLKADALSSFQPQDSNQQLIDIVPALADVGITVEKLRTALKGFRGSKPAPINAQQRDHLYNWLIGYAEIKLYGTRLEAIRTQNPQLASPTK